MALPVPTLQHDVQNALRTIIATQNSQLWATILPLLVAHIEQMALVVATGDTKTLAKDVDFAARIDEKKQAVVSQLLRFSKAAPFTVVRIAELLVDPSKEGYVLDCKERLLKYFNSLAKTVLVSSSVKQFPDVHFGGVGESVPNLTAVLVAIPWLDEKQKEGKSLRKETAETKIDQPEDNAGARNKNGDNSKLQSENSDSIKLQSENGDNAQPPKEGKDKNGENGTLDKKERNGSDHAENRDRSNGVLAAADSAEDKLLLDPMVLTPPLPNANPSSPSRRPRDDEHDHEDKKRRKNDRLASDDDRMDVSNTTLNSSPAALATPTRSFEDHDDANKFSDSETPLHDRMDVGSDRILADEEPLLH